MTRADLEAVAPGDFPHGRPPRLWTSVAGVFRPLHLAALLLSLLLPGAPSAQQFGGPRRTEVGMTYPFTAVGQWTYGGTGGRGLCTAFLVNNCTLVTAARCSQGKEGSFQFQASDGQRFPIKNVQTAPAKKQAASESESANKADKTPKTTATFDLTELNVAFGQIASRPGQPAPGERYGRFAFDAGDTVAASSGFTAHCSYGFSNNEEGKNGRGTIDPDVYVWGSLRRWFPGAVDSDEYFLHMTNTAYGASGSPIFRCLPVFNNGKLLGVDVRAPSRLIGVFVRMGPDRDKLKFPDRLRVEPKEMAWGIGGRQFYPDLADYVKDHPCEAVK